PPARRVHPIRTGRGRVEVPTPAAFRAARRRTRAHMATATAILHSLRSQLNTSEYKKLHWEGSFSDYLNMVIETPGITRTAYQRLYDMILSHGTDDVYENKDRTSRFKVFTHF